MAKTKHECVVCVLTTFEQTTGFAVLQLSRQFVHSTSVHLETFELLPACNFLVNTFDRPRQRIVSPWVASCLSSPSWHQFVWRGVHVCVLLQQQRCVTRAREGTPTVESSRTRTCGDVCHGQVRPWCSTPAFTTSSVRYSFQCKVRKEEKLKVSLLHPAPPPPPPYPYPSKSPGFNRLHRLANIVSRSW